MLKRKVKIGVVGYEMEGARSGVGRFLAGALEGLRETGSDWEWLVFFKGSPFEDPLFEADSQGRPAPVRPIFDGRPAARPILWEQLRLPEILREVEIDLLFSPAYSLPLRLPGVPGLLTLHDLSFEHLPGEFRFRERWRRRLLARWGARRAARVLTTATASARDLERTYSVPLGRLGLLPLAVDEVFFDGGSSLTLPGVRRPYLLWLATLLPRRRVDLAIAAFAAVANEFPELELVIAGADRLPDRACLAGLIAASGVAGRIRRLDYVPEDQVPALYAGAELSFYLSSFEGFGLPPLESLAAGTPAVVAPGLELDVLWPEYPLRAGLDAESVISATRRALEGEGRAELIGEARRRLRTLSWRRTAAALQAEIAAALPPEENT